MATYQSKPSRIEAVRNDGTIAGYEDVKRLAGIMVRRQDDGTVKLLAGRDGESGWVLVPPGHFIACAEGDPGDLWPVNPSHLEQKYEVVDG